jgi:hypothetical protein
MNVCTAGDERYVRSNPDLPPEYNHKILPSDPKIWKPGKNAVLWIAKMVTWNINVRAKLVSKLSHEAMRRLQLYSHDYEYRLQNGITPVGLKRIPDVKALENNLEFSVSDFFDGKIDLSTLTPRQQEHLRTNINHAKGYFKNAILTLRAREEDTWSPAQEGYDCETDGLDPVEEMIAYCARRVDVHGRVYGEFKKNEQVSEKNFNEAEALIRQKEAELANLKSAHALSSIHLDIERQNPDSRLEEYTKEQEAHRNMQRLFGPESKHEEWVAKAQRLSPSKLKQRYSVEPFGPFGLPPGGHTQPYLNLLLQNVHEAARLSEREQYLFTSWDPTNHLLRAFSSRATCFCSKCTT